MGTETSTSGIAVIGMGCWYPGAKNLRQLWENILARRQQFRQTPDQRLPLSDYYDPDPTVPDKTYGSRMAVIDGFEFDWASKRIPKTVVETADIAHWLALEVAIKALEDAGYTRETVTTGTGVLLGNTLTGEFSRSTNIRMRWPYARRALIAAAEAKGLPSQVVSSLAETMEEYYKSVFSPITEDTLSGNLSNTIAGRICNFFNFDGGGYTVDGACSSSLIAIANAATALTNGDLNLAIAGGVDISLDTFELIGFAKTGALTGGDMTVYDRKASGFIPGEGAGFVVLKRLKDARADGNYVYAVLNGWGISSDGKGGLTAPSRKGQATALRRAYDRAGYSPRDLDFIEGHGTGTPVGDRTELEGIALAMSSDGDPSPRSCGITSFKSLVGHTKAAAGVGAFIKAVIAVNRRVLPPVAGCKEPNAVFDAAAQCLYPILLGEVRTQTDILRAGVSAMGFGGINCHVTLESGDAPAAQLEPSIEERSLLVSNQDTEIIVLTAASVSALLQRISAVSNMAKGLSQCELTDLAFHLTRELKPGLPIRATVIAGTPDKLIEHLKLLEKLLRETPPSQGEVVVSPHKEVWVGNAVLKNRVGFLFPGQGSQQLNMARSLVERFSWARELVEQADAWLSEVGCQGIKEFIYYPLDRAVNQEQVEDWSRSLARTEVAQPAICLAELLWIRYLDRLGVKPVAVGGHSLGELSAFHAAGAFDEKTLLCLAAVRGQAMSASANGKGPGTMASLACSREIAEALLTQVNGYVVLANINSPRQMVISGTQASVEQAIEIATEQGISARRLPVSNGFHSQLVSAAAERLSKYKAVPETLKETAVSLFSSVDGQKPALGLRLHEHFANQVISQVDFISLVKTLTQTCDLLVEVGPGKVLSGLVRDIADVNKSNCFPVESKPGLDNLNTMLAALFVHGGEIKWQALYENRLLRPFVPAAERIFIENALEKPFQVSSVSASPALESSLPETLTQQSQVPWAQLSDYLSQRGAFLTQVIRADLETLPLLGNFANVTNGNGTGARESVRVSPASTPEVPKPVETQGAIARVDSVPGNIETVLVNLIAQQTGFTPQSITPETRLLDDLNLDSIKAGEVIATVAREFGVAGDIDPATLANAKIQEIAEAIRTVMPTTEGAGSTLNGSAAAQEKTEVETVLVNLIAQQTGFTPESITLEIRLLDDLNLDSIKAGEVIATAAKEFGVAGDIDPATLANAKIQEIAEAIRAVMPDKTEGGGSVLNGLAAAPTEVEDRSRITPPVVMPEVKRKALVRDFIVRVAEELPSVPSEGHIEENWQSANVLILCEADKLDIAAAVGDQFKAQGADVQVVSFTSARNQALINSGDFTHFIAVLPHIASSELSPSHLLDTIGRLNILAVPPQEARKRRTVAYVQFGGGYFGIQPQIADISQCCAVSFAASIHLEQPELKVRVIDFSPTVDPATLAERVLSELSTQDGYAAVGYDAHLTRRVPRPCVQEPAFYANRDLTWSSEDVIVVTGGAKGITAECAIALARDTGAKMALVGRSQHPDYDLEKRANTETARTLERFKSEGLTCQYYMCDVSDFNSVTTVLQRIRQELGEITGVVHGAAVNLPRLAAQVSDAAAFDEVSPKLLGVMNLCQAFGDTPLKLFAGLSSVIGVTGMQRNAWYAFSNEAMDMILRRFQAQHPQTVVLSVAYSVWDEVGMGARMGSVRSLSKMGISAIPKDEGVRRFLHLVKNDPGDVQVVVVAAMRTKAALDMEGFDTWSPPLFPLPAASRFLEQLPVYEPGVEVVARAHLNPNRDLYLRDHVYKGSYLFPTVFGLEAMAQAVACATGEQAFPALRIENIRLERPIVVDPDRGVEIEIHAEVIERETENSVRRISAAIRTEQTGFAIDHFSATFILGIESNPPTKHVELPEAPIDIQAHDLYNWLLFQGPLFQRLQLIYSLKPEKFVFGAEMRASSSAGKDGFADEAMPLILGDPYFRDSLLQSAQVVIPKDLCLPVRIDSIEIYQRHSANSGMRVGVMTPNNSTEREYSSTVFAIDDRGQIIERLDGYVTRLLEHREDNPSAEEIVDPSKRDETILRSKLNEQTELFDLSVPEIVLANLPGLHSLPKEERHQRELPLLHKAAALALNGSEYDTEKLQFKWNESGKPVLELVEGPVLDVSLSHDNQVCICVVGQGPQGCDIEPVVQRSLSEWTGLLSNVHKPILQQLMDGTDPLDRAGTRIWAAMEALRKAMTAEISLEIDSCKANSVLFNGIVGNHRLKVLTFPLKLTRGSEKIVACVVKQEQSIKPIQLSGKERC